MTPDEIMSHALQEQSAVNQTADAFAMTLGKSIQSGNAQGIIDVVRSAINTLDRDAEGPRQEAGAPRTVDRSAGKSDD